MMKHTDFGEDNSYDIRTQKEQGIPDFDRYPHPFVSGAIHSNTDGLSPRVPWFTVPPRNLVERKLIHLSSAIREDDCWFEKINEESAIADWRRRGRERGATEEMIRYVLDELRYHTETWRRKGYSRSIVYGVWQSDDLISGDLRRRLAEQDVPLQHSLERSKNTHLGSEKTLFDLLHPTLFSYIAGVTRVVQEPSSPLLWERFLGAGQVMEGELEKRPGIEDFYHCKKYQWLPSDISVSKDGEVKFLSYINNLHPEECGDLYKVIEAILSRFIPLFSEVLTDLVLPRGHRIASAMPVVEDVHVNNLAVGDHEDDANLKNWPEADHRPKDNAALKFKVPNENGYRVNLLGRSLQVIVKAASVELTPAKPKYPGALWHVEGMDNDRIVASGIYYWHVRNLTESRLEFRRGVPAPITYLGNIVTREGRCVAFPNFYQHNVSPFELLDKSKPGERKLLLFFLIDPKERILSTASVPPQQQSWLQRELRKKVGSRMTYFNELPEHLLSKIVSKMDFPLSLEKAKVYREESMRERKCFNEENNRILEQTSFRYEHEEREISPVPTH